MPRRNPTESLIKVTESARERVRKALLEAGPQKVSNFDMAMLTSAGEFARSDEAYARWQRLRKLRGKKTGGLTKWLVKQRLLREAAVGKRAPHISDTRNQRLELMNRVVWQKYTDRTIALLKKRLAEENALEKRK